MDYVNLGRSGVKVSRLCLGTMMFGGPTDEGDSARIIHRALDAGINFLDTANIYNAGESEVVTGRAIRNRRADVVLATKARNAMSERPNDQGLSRVHLLRACEDSLRRLGTDYIDLYYMHAPDHATPLEESLRALDDLVRHGKVRYVACSNYYAYQVALMLGIAEARNLERMTCVQPLYNIVNRDIEVELLPFCRDKGIGVVVYSPLARGVLTGKYQPGQAPPEGSRAGPRTGPAGRQPRRPRGPAHPADGAARGELHRGAAAPPARRAARMQPLTVCPRLDAGEPDRDKRHHRSPHHGAARGQPAGPGRAPHR
jgi:aryl-alcohol dehydrogenase-like predicted oxidoreductase